MKRFKLTLLTLFLTINCFAQDTEIKKITNRFLDTVQKHSYVTKNINWDSLRPAILEKIASIEDPNKLYPIFSNVLAQLKDNHSSVLFRKYVEGQPPEMDEMELLMTKTDQELGFPPKKFKHELIQGKYAYINIPAVISEHGKYIDTMKSQLAYLDSQKPKAWIIDLTENHGGSAIPMLWNLYNLIDKDHKFNSIYNDGREVVQPRQITSPGDNETLKLFFKIFDLKNKKPFKIKNNKIPIIVLVSNVTASSGEITACYFLGQKNVIVLGQKTAGLTSGNDEFKLNNSYIINLTTSVFKDRNGKVYNLGERITPDVIFEFDYYKFLKEGENIDLYKAIEIVENNKEIFINKAVEYLSNKNI